MNTDLFSILTGVMQLPAGSLKGNTAVVTGAGRGIGLQTARAFAMLGADVVLAELSVEGEEAARQIRAEGGSGEYVHTDVSDAASVKRLVERTRQRFGPVSILVNNAIAIHEGTVASMPLEAWDQTIAVNLRGTFLTCQAFLADMLTLGRGTILNMVSTDAMPGLAAYIASKQGIVGFSQSLSLEVASSGVRVIPFAPGMVDTPGIRSVAAGLAPRLGMKEEQFLSISLHAGYEGFMPAEHAGAAGAYLALRLGDEFNGQLVSGYEVLERAGLLQPPEVPPAEAAPDRQAITGRRELLEELAGILAETDREFDRLPVFVRPIARQGFKNKSGRSSGEWLRLIKGLAEGSLAAPAGFGEQLERLSGYYCDVPKETARFTRDAEMLGQVAELSNRRIEVIRRLRELIALDPQVNQ